MEKLQIFRPICVHTNTRSEEKNSSTFPFSRIYPSLKIHRVYTWRINKDGTIGTGIFYFILFLQARVNREMWNKILFFRSRSRKKNLVWCRSIVFRVFFFRGIFQSTSKGKKEIIFHRLICIKIIIITCHSRRRRERILSRLIIIIQKRSPARLQCKVILIACKFRMIKLKPYRARVVSLFRGIKSLSNPLIIALCIINWRKQSSPNCLTFR